MKNMLRYAELILLGVLIVAGIILWLLLWMSKGKIMPLRDAAGNIIEGSISQRCYTEINGVKNGMFIQGKNTDNPVLLLVSSGPGTPDYFLTEAYPKMNLADYYTICYWEYRGACLSYDSKADLKTITTEQLVSDTAEITRYLMERFHKDKIYIMGFSGGSYIALKTAAVHPELYEAYFGMAQMICQGPDNDTLIYNFMHSCFSEKKDTGRLKRLESLVTHLPNGQVMTNDWMRFCALLHEAGGGTIKDKTEFTSIVIPLLKSKCYTLGEKINYIRGLKAYSKTPLYQEMWENDFRKSLPSVDIPVYFLSGEYDYNCPWRLVQEYCEMLDAPVKGFYSFSDSAHSPLWEQPKETIEVLKNVLTQS